MALCGHMSMHAMLVIYTHVYLDVCISVSVNTHHVYMAVQFS